MRAPRRACDRGARARRAVRAAWRRTCESTLSWSGRERTAVTVDASCESAEAEMFASAATPLPIMSMIDARVAIPAASSSASSSRGCGPCAPSAGGSGAAELSLCASAAQSCCCASLGADLAALRTLSTTSTVSSSSPTCNGSAATCRDSPPNASVARVTM
jgi:hypothetical protein